MKQTIFLIFLLFFCIACQKEELPESGEEMLPKAKTLCEKYVSHIQSPFPNHSTQKRFAWIPSI